MDTVWVLYETVERIKKESLERGLPDLAAQFEHALALGSSSLEIIGAIKIIIVQNRPMIEAMLAPNGKQRVDEMIDFVDRAYGRKT
jgi:hypothetical protein